MVLATKGDHVARFILLINRLLFLLSFFIVENSESTELSKILDHDLMKNTTNKEETFSDPFDLRSPYSYGM